MLSVITITRNDPEGLRRTQLSLTEQQQDLFEWVVIDGSDERIQAEDFADGRAPDQLQTGASDGIYDAMNRGSLLASRPLLLFLNGGDILAGPTVLRQAIDRIKSVDRERTRIHAFAYILANECDIEVRRRARPPTYIHHGLPTSHQAIVYPREPVVDIGYDVSYRIAGDYALTATLLAGGVNYNAHSLALSKFFVAGVSSDEPALLDRECRRVQQELLGHGHGFVLLSTALRRATTRWRRHRLG